MIIEESESRRLTNGRETKAKEEKEEERNGMHDK